MLYIVGTPIGNLKDITLRAIEVLKSVDVVACEDTRHSKILLQHYGIQTPTTSYFQYNRVTKGKMILGLLKQGKNVALVSDAGMPGILDPGHYLIGLAIQNNIEITAIPGPSAFINALVLSGKPSHKFIFAGFLPNSSGARRNRLKNLAEAKQTIVFYESCHRVIKTLEDIQDVFGDRPIVCARELTKKFEEVKRASSREILAGLKRQKVRGEFVLVV